jgi:hypothetical protein
MLQSGAESTKVKLGEAGVGVEAEELAAVVEERLRTWNVLSPPKTVCPCRLQNLGDLDDQRPQLLEVQRQILTQLLLQVLLAEPVDKLMLMGHKTKLEDVANR